MEQKHKESIKKRLSDTHFALKAAIVDLDLDLVIHPETDWRIRDILGHIATWDRVLIEAIDSFLAGSEYVIIGMDGVEDDFNNQKVKEQRSLTSSEIFQEWEKARLDFIAVVERIPAERFSDELAYPWGDERGTVTVMIEYMIDHNGEHQEEIQNALK